jgi:hypothetical protein
MEKGMEKALDNGNTVKLIRRIVDQAISKANESMDSEYTYSLNDVSVEINDDGTLTIRISVVYGIKLMEISWDIAEAIDSLPEEEREKYTEDDLEALFDEWYSSQLDEINSEYMIDADIDIRLGLSRDYVGFGDVIARASPLACEMDYCLVGLSIDVIIEKMYPEYIANFKDFISDKIAELLIKIVELALI